MSLSELCQELLWTLCSLSWPRDIPRGTESVLDEGRHTRSARSPSPPTPQTDGHRGGDLASPPLAKSLLSSPGLSPDGSLLRWACCLRACSERGSSGPAVPQGLGLPVHGGDDTLRESVYFVS